MYSRRVRTFTRSLCAYNVITNDGHMNGRVHNHMCQRYHMYTYRTRDFLFRVQYTKHANTKCETKKKLALHAYKYVVFRRRRREAAIFTHAIYHIKTHQKRP